jgi:hypothetical protein
MVSVEGKNPRQRTREGVVITINPSTDTVQTVMKRALDNGVVITSAEAQRALAIAGRQEPRRPIPAAATKPIKLGMGTPIPPRKMKPSTPKPPIGRR